MTDTQAYLEGFGDVARKIKNGLREPEAHELGRRAAFYAAPFGLLPRGTLPDSYWAGVSAGVAAALGV